MEIGPKKWTIQSMAHLAHYTTINMKLKFSQLSIGEFSETLFYYSKNNGVKGQIRPELIDADLIGSCIIF